MEPKEFYIVDVFAEEKYAGNQLAVFTDAQGLSDEQMQKIALETHFSETTFVLSRAERQGGYDVRIFTPAREVPFAGHPTLGTAYVIREQILQTQAKQVNLNLKAGQIPVTFAQDRTGEVVWMKQNPPDFGAITDAAEVADVLGLNPSQIDSRFAAQEVSTGMPFVIVPLTDLSAVKQARIVRDKYDAFIAKREAKAILVFCAEPYSSQNDLNVRVFVPYYGVDEDPATGSGNGCLAAYLVEHRYFGQDSIDVRVEQGYEINRPSRIYLRAKRENGTTAIHVGGKVIPVANGAFI
jgi:trans-2,3-dihydro-3-hydroxyanthranilate isomerase